MKDFETQLKEMCDVRKKNECFEYNSINGKTKEIIIDFKCWAFSKNFFYNLDIKLFTQYIKENKKYISEDIKRRIAEKYFGYEFNFSYNDNKWHIIKKGNLLINN